MLAKAEENTRFNELFFIAKGALMKYRFKCYLFVLQMILSTNPLLFMLLYQFFGKHKELLVNKKTQIVIEGFPRSGNTFSVVALEWAQDKEVNIAHHLHASAQLIWAVKKKIPAVALIRSPVDAVVSLLIREPHITIEAGLFAYYKFYNSLIPYKKNIAIIEFEQIISDYGESIRFYNNKFGLDFNIFQHNDQNVDKVFKLVQNYSAKESSENKLDEKKVARPSEGRKEQAKILNKEINNDKYKVLLLKASVAYSSLVEK